MFYCDPCGRKRDWPIKGYGSHGPCEICGKVANCNDVPSKYLPIPTPEQAEPPEPDEDRALVTVDVIDVAVPWLREDHRGRPLPEHDYRFQISRPGGARATFHVGATAEHVYEYCKREGWLAK